MCTQMSVHHLLGNVSHFAFLFPFPFFSPTSRVWRWKARLAVMLVSLSPNEPCSSSSSSSSSYSTTVMNGWLWLLPLYAQAALASRYRHNLSLARHKNVADTSGCESELMELTSGRQQKRSLELPVMTTSSKGCGMLRALMYPRLGSVSDLHSKLPCQH